MEHHFSVLLYSKYSSLSNNIMNTMQTSGVDFKTKYSLEYLCIDNQEIRKRILKNKKIQVTSVPCLLLIFPDGGIEKYEGNHIFEWVTNIIQQYAPPPPPSPPPVISPPPPSQEELKRDRQITEERHKKVARKRALEENKREYEKKYGENLESTRDSKKESQITQITDLDELSSEEDDNESDRFRSPTPKSKPEENQDKPNRRKLKINNTPTDTPTDAKSKKSTDIMSKAKEMERGRETPSTHPPGHPLNKKM
jgi:flagellar biosynthesis GTPase FlhF